MERRKFFGNVLGLIGVAASAKDISSIGFKKRVLSIPTSARYGDILYNLDMKPYHFSGKKIIPLTEGESIEDFVFSDTEPDFIVIYNANKEKTL